MSARTKGRKASKDTQKFIAGTDSRVAALETAGNAVLDAYDKKESAIEKVRKSEQGMMQAMKKEGYTQYTVNGQKFKIEDRGEKLTVKKIPIGKTANG